MKEFIRCYLTHSTETLGLKLPVLRTLLTYQDLPCGEVTVNRYFSIKKLEKSSVKTEKNKLISALPIRGT